MRRVIVPLMLAIMLQTVLFSALILFGGTLNRLNQNAIDILNERVINRKNYLQNEMIQRWSNVSETQETIEQKVSAFLLQNNLSHTDLTPDNPNTTTLIGELSETLIYMMRRNTINGAFIILEGDGARPAEGQPVEKAGLYLRDLDPISTPSDNSDLMAERGASAVLKAMHITSDIHWTPRFSMTNDNDYYYQPLNAALEHPEIDKSDLGYWSAEFKLSDNDIEIFTYTQPLINSAGKVYGVLGVEISTDYLRRLLPYSELSSEKTAGYFLGFTPDYEQSQSDFTTVYSAGPVIKQQFGGTDSFSITPHDDYESVFGLTTPDTRNSESLYCSVQFLNLYNTNTPFVQQRWALVGVLEADELFAFANNITSTIVYFTLIFLALGLGLSLLIGYFVANPILSLARKVRNADPRRQIQLENSRIREIDALSSSIEQLSRNVAESSSRLSKIIEISQINIGAFEWNKSNNMVYVTENFFPLFGQPALPDVTSCELFETRIQKLTPFLEESFLEGNISIFKVPLENGESRWLRMKIVETQFSHLGVIVDVSSEMMEKRKIEYERDYDLLTNLLNRRAFHTRTEKLQAHPDVLKTGALIMMDLDNLKYINDTYGHDCGDGYIRCAADVLRHYGNVNSVVARMSGDEFFLFFYGYENRDQIKAVIQKMRTDLANASLVLPDGTSFKLRASAGIAWYPDDSTDVQQLIQFADFAMYEVKHSTKGEIKDFDIATYQRDSFLLYSHEELNSIIDDNRVDFAFQPIVSCKTGEIFAFEALMRPRSKALSSPVDILRVARNQSKLYQIERLSWFVGMEQFVNLEGKSDDCLIFINSISSQELKSDDWANFDRLYHGYLDRIVIELTENEEANILYTQAKQKQMALFQAKIALDDFGTGYNSETMLLTVNPNFVKVDMGIVRNIHEDKNRQELFSSLVHFCHERGIRVIAEGVETKEEMNILVALGADFLQGFYLCKPQQFVSPIPATVLEELREAGQNLPLDGQEQLI